MRKTRKQTKRYIRKKNKRLNRRRRVRKKNTMKGGAVARIGRHHARRTKYAKKSQKKENTQKNNNKTKAQREWVRQVRPDMAQIEGRYKRNTQKRGILKNRRLATPKSSGRKGPKIHFPNSNNNLAKIREFEINNNNNNLPEEVEYTPLESYLLDKYPYITEKSLAEYKEQVRAYIQANQKLYDDYALSDGLVQLTNKFEAVQNRN